MLALFKFNTVIPAKAGNYFQYSRMLEMGSRLRGNDRLLSKGFTLIEVLVALAIIGIAMTAIIKAVSENIRGTSYLENKTVAMWVGKQVLNNARLGLITFSGADTTKEKTTTMLGREWYWQAEETETPNPKIKKIDVKVFSKKNRVDESPLIELETYVYRNES